MIDFLLVHLGTTEKTPGMAGLQKYSHAWRACQLSKFSSIGSLTSVLFTALYQTTQKRGSLGIDLTNR